MTHQIWRAPDNPLILWSSAHIELASATYILRPVTSGPLVKHQWANFEQMESSASDKGTSNCSSSDHAAATVWLVTGANRGMGFAYVSQARHSYALFACTYTL